MWCSHPESNRDGLYGPRDFKSLASTYSAMAAGVEKSFGGSGEIRTHGWVAPSLVFKTSPFNHSGTLPLLMHAIPKQAGIALIKLSYLVG